MYIKVIDKMLAKCQNNKKETGCQNEKCICLTAALNARSQSERFIYEI